MKKFLFFAFALVASALVFTSCDKNDSQNPIKGAQFYHDHERYGFVREVLSLGTGNYFELSSDIYEDAERTKLISASGDYGIYEINEEQKYIDMTFKGSYEVVDGAQVKHEGSQAHRDARWTYRLDGDALIITYPNGMSDTFLKK